MLLVASVAVALTAARRLAPAFGYDVERSRLSQVSG